MMKRKKLAGMLFGIWFIGMFVVCIVKPDRDISYAERRKLATPPEITVAGILDGSFMDKHEKYLADQFPGRELFRRGKALFDYKILRKKEVHGIYVENGQAGELFYELDEKAVAHAAKRVSYVVREKIHSPECHIYYGIIPDKSYYIAGKQGYPAMNYEKFMDCFQDSLMEEREQMTQILLWDCLTADDYYTTDLHWRQENIADVAEVIAAAMGTTAYKEEELFWKTAGDFYGVYYGQAALPLAPDELCYGTNEQIDACQVYDPLMGEQTGVYDLERVNGLDRYDLFLSGPKPLLVIKNPLANTGRRLVMFRDSFGSSLTPYLLRGYDEITLVDPRYFHPDLLGEYLTFTDQDVLFLFYTGLIGRGYLFK